MGMRGQRGQPPAHPRHTGLGGGSMADKPAGHPHRLGSQSQPAGCGKAERFGIAMDLAHHGGQSRAGKRILERRQHIGWAADIDPQQRAPDARQIGGARLAAAEPILRPKDQPRRQAGQHKARRRPIERSGGKSLAQGRRAGVRGLRIWRGRGRRLGRREGNGCHALDQSCSYFVLAMSRACVNVHDRFKRVFLSHARSLISWRDRVLFCRTRHSQCLARRVASDGLHLTPIGSRNPAGGRYGSSG